MSETTETQDQADAQAQADEEAQQGGEATERFGGGGRATLLVGYVVVMAGVAGLLWLLLQLGGGLQAPPAETGGGAAGPRAMVSAEKILWKVLLAGIVIIITARIVGGLLRRIHQPHVIGEIIAGIMLGPSLLGAIWPGAFDFLFPVELMSYLDLVANFGLIFYMFLVGLELNFDLMRGRGHAAVWVSHISIIAPFLLGVALSLWLYPTIGSGAGFTAFALFMGAAMAITAFPVLARILTDRGLYKTQIGTVTLTVGAVDDITAWSILAVIIPVARATSMTSALVSVGAALAFALATIYWVRPLVLRVSNYYERRDKLPGWFLAVLFVGILLWALVTDKLGIHVIFGAFLFGAIMPHDAKFVRLLTEKLEDFSVVFLLPFFFTFSGIRTNIFAIGTSPQLWLMTLAILVVAIAGKWGGSKLAARFAGLEWREAGALGVLVNCRGLTELIILNIGLQLRVLPSSAFAMMVIMAVVTTLMTEPALALYYPRHLQRKMIREAEEGAAAEEAVEEEEEAAAEGTEARPERRRLLVAVGKPDAAEELTQMATLLAGDGGERNTEVTLLRVVDVSGTEVSHASSVQDSMLEDAVERLRPFVETVEEAGFDADPLAIAAGDVGETIARIANEREVDLVLLGYHEAVFGERLLGGIVGEVLREAQADVAVLVDPNGPRQLRLSEDTRIVVPFGGGFHEEAGLAIARRLGAASGGKLALLGPASDEGELEEQASEASERNGADTTPLPVEGDLTDELVDRADDFDLLVLGVSDSWGRGGSLESVREEVMEHSGTPYLIVRRHGEASSGLLRWWRNLKQAWQRSDESRSDERGDGEGQQEVGEAEKQTRERL